MDISQPIFDPSSPTLISIETLGSGTDFRNSDLGGILLDRGSVFEQNIIVSLDTEDFSTFLTTIDIKPVDCKPSVEWIMPAAGSEVYALVETVI